MKRYNLIVGLIFLVFIAGMTCHSYAQNKQKLSRKERKLIQKREQQQMEEELNGYMKVKADVRCDLFKPGLKVAILPFGAESREQVDDSYTPGKLLREYMEVYLSRLGYTVVGRERTNQYLKQLERLISDNVFAADELRNLKEQIGADIFVTGTVNHFIRGEKGTPGSMVSFTAKCQLIETDARMVWMGTCESRSGAYYFDKSPVFLLQQDIEAFFNELELEINQCKNE